MKSVNAGQKNTAPKKRMKPSQKAFVFEILKISITLLIGGACVFFGSQQVHKTSEHIIKTKKDLLTFQQKNEAITAAQEYFKKIDAAHVKVEESLIYAEKIDDFLKDVENIGIKQKLSPQITFSAPTPGQASAEGISLSRIDFVIAARGNVTSLQLFLAEFERLPYFADISGITINTATQEGWTNDSKINLIGKIFIREDDAANSGNLKSENGATSSPPSTPATTTSPQTKTTDPANQIP